MKNLRIDPKTGMYADDNWFPNREAEYARMRRIFRVFSDIFNKKSEKLNLQYKRDCKKALRKINKKYEKDKADLHRWWEEFNKIRHGYWSEN